MAGPRGLDYGAMFQVADRIGICVDEEMLHRIKALEAAYVDEYHGIRSQGDREPACRHPDACAMCKKRCSARVK